MKILIYCSQHPEVAIIYLKELKHLGSFLLQDIVDSIMIILRKHFTVHLVDRWTKVLPNVTYAFSKEPRLKFKLLVIVLVLPW